MDRVADIDAEYEWLDLADRRLGVEDCVVVGRLVRDNPTATALDLSLNLLAGHDGESMDGILALCETLRHNTTLTMLDLQVSNCTAQAHSMRVTPTPRHTTHTHRKLACPKCVLPR